MSVARTPLTLIACLTFAFACAGPAGKDGAPGPAGPPGDAGVAGDPGTPQALTAETCVLCHGAGQLADTTTMHKAAALPAMSRNLALITSASIPAAAPIKPTITFTVTDVGGSPVTGLTSFNFTVAQLVPTDAAGGSIDNWRPVLMRNYATVPDVSPGGAVEASVNARSATTPSAQVSGVLVESAAGTYTYTFGNDLSVPFSVPAGGTLPAFGVVVNAFDPSLTTRIGVMSNAPILGQNPATAANGTVIQPTAPFTATADILPDGTLFTNPDSTVANQQKHDSRAIVTAAACDQCHQRLTAHGRRVNVNFCVTCHNSSSFDPKTPATDRQTVDFKRVVHKLHMGKNLPSVKAGGSFTFNGEDFSDVSFPVMSSNGTSDPGNCTVCHNATSATFGAPADSWKNKPTMVACGSCHDRTSFDVTAPAGWTLHTGGPQPDDQLCTACHASGAGIAPIDFVHTGLSSVQKTLTGKYKYNIVKVENTAPGQNPVVTFQVLDGSGTPYMLTEPPWTQTANGNSRLAIDIAWSTRLATSAADTNFTNDGSGTMPGQPVTIDALKSKVATATAGTFTVTSPVAVPANAVGVGQAVMEGHPAEPVGRPPVQQRIPVTSVTKTFAITGTSTAARRKVVDIAKCNVCHVNLSLHGSNRTSSIETCVSCHNTNATDIRQRPKTGTTLDGKAEESIDFKKLIHGIHGAEFSGNGPVIYGFGGSANDFRATGFPGVINNCEACHNPGTYTAGFADANGTTTSTETLADPSTYLRTTKVTATCSACHAQKLTVDHMLQNGGHFDATQAQIDATTR
jgi:OmcA/MtrC family decaheme c-type cytochrome